MLREFGEYGAKLAAAVFALIGLIITGVCAYAAISDADSITAGMMWTFAGIMGVVTLLYGYLIFGMSVPADKAAILTDGKGSRKGEALRPATRHWIGLLRRVFHFEHKDVLSRNVVSATLADGHTVNWDLQVKYDIDLDQAGKLYDTYGVAFANVPVEQYLALEVRSAIAKLKWSDIPSNRAQLEQTLTSQVGATLGSLGVESVVVSLKGCNFES
jgi:hypothetical protein